ncbi:c-type cytochrome [Hephaestia mangrovi]|uniref:c-type cytochrome n=1 Tax=Hephaestia mangrovi TaxID=2873268 RepID=UPI001CA66FA8|nr:c-type cytochrome [Hephaestia mangrovi]MBY8827957.1 c-type cytochrome [Hephaestia mangrovi]
MKVKVIGLSIAALSAASFAVLLHAAPPAIGLTVDITAPADNSRLPWNAQAAYAVTASYDGKSTKYGELPANSVVLRATYVANADAPAARQAAPLPEALVQVSRSNCMGCHDFAASSAGPSFAAIGKRYAGRAGAAALLAGHIRNGSSGSWGGGAMPPHPDLSATQAIAIAQWIIAHGNDPTTHYSIGRSGSFRMSAPAKPGPHAGMVLSAFYTGALKPGDTRAASGRDTIVVHGAGS